MDENTKGFFVPGRAIAILRLYPCNDETVAAMLPARLFRRGT
jgi:hypothetical protein